MNWEVILWTCITVGVLLCVAGIIISIVSARNVKKRTNDLKEVHTTLHVGSKVMVAGGIYGNVTKVEDEVVSVEIAKGTIIQVSRYGINSILS